MESFIRFPVLSTPRERLACRRTLYWGKAAHAFSTRTLITSDVIPRQKHGPLLSSSFYTFINYLLKNSFHPSAVPVIVTENRKFTSYHSRPIKMAMNGSRSLWPGDASVCTWNAIHGRKKRRTRSKKSTTTYAPVGHRSSRIKARLETPPFRFTTLPILRKFSMESVSENLWQCLTQRLVVSTFCFLSTTPNDQRLELALVQVSRRLRRTTNTQTMAPSGK